MIKREYKVNFGYFKTTNKQQLSGNAHAHILVDRYLPINQILSIWTACGGGKIGKIIAVDIQHIAPYLSKYFSDDRKGELQLPPRIRHYSQSKKLMVRLMVHESGWKLKIYDGATSSVREVVRSDFSLSVEVRLQNMLYRPP